MGSGRYARRARENTWQDIIGQHNDYVGYLLTVQFMACSQSCVPGERPIDSRILALTLM